MPPGHRIHSSVPSYNVALAKIIFGDDIVVVTEAQAYPGYDRGEDPTPEEEALLETWRLEPMGRDKVMRRGADLVVALRDLAGVASLIGSSGLDNALGCWSNDLPEGGDEVLEELILYLGQVRAEVGRRVLLLDACYRRDPAFNQPD